MLRAEFDKLHYEPVSVKLKDIWKQHRGPETAKSGAFATMLGKQLTENTETKAIQNNIEA